MWFRVLAARVRGLIARKQLDQGLAAEVREHLRLLAEENMRRGMGAEEARMAAKREFGGVEQTKELYRERRGLPTLETFWNDLRYAVRMLRKSPGFATVAILTLALGIGANTSIFSILDPLLLRKLPVSHPDELVRVDAAGSLGNVGAWEASAYERFRDNSRVFSGVLSFIPVSLDAVSHDGQSGSARAEVVSTNYFTVLGLSPFAGRLIPADEERGHAVVLGFDYWRREFRADVSVLGKTLIVQGAPYTVIGVAPSGFFGLRVGEAADFYLPSPPGKSTNPNIHALDWTQVIARLKPGVSPTQALSALQPELEQIQAKSQLPKVEIHQMMDHLLLTPASRGLSSLRYRFSLSAQILMGVVGLVLLIACSNVANLLLAQNTARKREITVRLALGAQRSRLVRQLLTEGAVLAAAGALGGMLAAQWTSRLIVAALSDARTHVVLATGLNGRVLLFTLATAILAVLLCGLVPAFSATRAGVGLDIKTWGSGHARTQQSRLGGFLVTGQVALSVTVLVAGGLLLHSLFNLETMDAGFDRDHVLTVDMDGISAKHGPEKVKSFYDQLLEKARALPGVRSTAISSFVPMGGRVFGINLAVEGYTAHAGEDVHVFLTSVTPGYFDTLGIQLLQGRDFTPQDNPNSPRVAIINRALARHYFGGQDPVGKRMQTVEGDRTFQIVGVVADSKYNSLREDAQDFFYLDTLQSASLPAVCTLSVRVAGNAASLRTTLPGLVHSLDGSVRINKVATLRELTHDSVHMDRLIAALCGAFGLLALTLTCIGLYGVLSFGVARKANEIGIRVALGAEPGHIFRLFVGRGMRLVTAGLLIGLAGALVSTSVLKNLLFGVRRDDPITFVGICLLLALAAFAACYLPARRAMRVDPMEALRHE